MSLPNIPFAYVQLAESSTHTVEYFAMNERSMMLKKQLRVFLAGIALGFAPIFLFSWPSTVGAQSIASDEQLLQAEGPKPYPQNVNDMPGRGSARIFPWMMQDRKKFWSERTLKQGAVVFVGDSLTARFRPADLNIPGVIFANRGIGGDTSRGLLFRFKEDVLDLRPSTIVLLIGTNDLSAKQAPSDTIYNISKMLEMVQSNSPEITVILCTIPPRENPKAVIDSARLVELNGAIRQLGGRTHNTSVFDLNGLFSNSDGSPNLIYFQADRLHIAEAGYTTWSEAVRPLLLGRIKK